jgi:hypothetical protein
MGLPSVTTKDGRRVEIPYATKERPNCRRVITSLCRERGITLGELWAHVQEHPARYSVGLRKQCRLMVWEEYEESGR